MRIKLPPSVISQIESHLRPDFHPIITLSTLTQLPATPTTKSKRPSNFKPSLQTKSHAGALSKTRSTSDPIPISPPHLFRKTLKSHIEAAHHHLNSEKFNRKNASTILRRQVTYSKLISTFLNHPKGLKGIQSLLNRSLQERIPISVPTLTSVLKSVLSSDDINDRIMTINQILPVLPEKLDVPLLDVLLRNVIRDTNPDSGLVEKMINDCLALGATELTSKNGVVGKEDWPLEIWDLLFTSYYQNLDLKNSLITLNEFKEVIQNKLNNEPSTSYSIRKTIPDILNEKEKQSICKIYTTVLNTWRKSQGINKSGSRFPRNLARELIGLIGESTKPTLSFLNSWMKSERLSGDYQASLKIWELIGSKEREDNLPNADSWISLLQLYPPSSSSTSGGSNGNQSIEHLPPFENSLKRLLKQVKYYPKLDLLNMLLINTLLGCTLPSNLPTSLLILQQMDSQGREKHIIPDRKLVDKLASSLMSIITNLPLDDQLELGITHPNKRKDAYLDLTNSRNRRKRMGLNLEEWDLITEVLHNIRLEQISKQEGFDFDFELRGRMMVDSMDTIWLPLSMPIGRLRSGVENSIPSPSNDQLIVRNSGMEDNNLEMVRKLTLPEKILPSLIILLKKLIVHLERRRLASAKIDIDKMGDEEVLKVIMDKVENDLLPHHRKSNKRIES